MEKELANLQKLTDLILSGEQYGYSKDLLHLGVTMDVIGCEALMALPEQSDEKHLSTLLDISLENLDSKLDDRLDKATDEAERTIRQVQAKRSTHTIDVTDEFGARFFAAVSGALTGSMHALTIVNRIVRNASYAATDPYRTAAAQANAKIMGATVAKHQGAMLRRATDTYIADLKHEGQFLLKLKNMIPGFGESADFHAGKANILRGAHAIDDARTAQAALNQKCDETIRESEKLLRDIKSARNGAMKAAGSSAMPLWKKAGTVALLIAVHTVLWYIVAKIVLYIVNSIERRMKPKRTNKK